MTLPPQDSQQYELRRRIVECRERLRRNRSGAQKSGRAGGVQTKPSADVQKKEAQRKK